MLIRPPDEPGAENQEARQRYEVMQCFTVSQPKSFKEEGEGRGERPPLLTLLSGRAGRRRSEVGWQGRQEGDQPPSCRATWGLSLAWYGRCPAWGRSWGRCLKFTAASSFPFLSKLMPSSHPGFPGPLELPPGLLAVSIP